MYLPALPTIAREFGTAASVVQSSLAAYFIGIAIGQAFYGPLSDRLGRKPILYLGLVLFMVSSIGCARAESVNALIAFRFLQALGGCAPIVIPRAIVRDHFDQSGSVRMLSVLMLVMGLAPILAPLIGGQLLVHFGWRAVFWLLTAYAATWLAVVAIFLPESLPSARRLRHPIKDVLQRLLASGARPQVHGARTVGRVHLRRTACVHLRIAGCLHRVVRCAARALRRVLRHQRGRHHRGLTDQSLARRSSRDAPDCQHRARGGDDGGRVSSCSMHTVDSEDSPGILVPLFFYIACHGFVLPNTTALAMAPHGRVAGSASALLGTFQFVGGAIAGSLVGAFANGTPVPMAAVVAGCGAIRVSRQPVRDDLDAQA